MARKWFNQEQSPALFTKNPVLAKRFIAARRFSFSLNLFQLTPFINIGFGADGMLFGHRFLPHVVCSYLGHILQMRCMNILRAFEVPFLLQNVKNCREMLLKHINVFYFMF